MHCRQKVQTLKASVDLAATPTVKRAAHDSIADNCEEEVSPIYYLVRRGICGELREPDDVAQQDGDGVEGLRRGDLAPLQLVDDGPAGCNSIDICWNLRLELRCKLRQKDAFRKAPDGATVKAWVKANQMSIESPPGFQS